VSGIATTIDERDFGHAGARRGATVAPVTSRRRAPGALLLVCDFAARQPGAFIASQLAVARAVETELGLRTVLALPARAWRRDWVARVAAEGVAVRYLPASARERLRALPALAREHDARIVHAHFVWFDVDSALAAARTGAGLVWHLHNGLLDYPLRRRLSDAGKVRVVGRRCDAVIAVSEQVRDDARRRGFPERALEVVLNGIDVDRFGARPAAAGGDGPPVVLSYCWDPRRKGADVLLRAVARLRRSDAGPRPVLVLVGTERLHEHVVRELGTVPDWVRVVAPVDDVAARLRAAAVFVSAAREEGFSYAVGEAMACGLPVIGSDIGGTAHFHDAPGYLTYPVEDDDALAARLARVLGDPAAAAALGGANARWVREHLSVERFVRETVGVYARVLARR
jgi:glycosyltransferase involved in cell wall biosynthesis